MKSSQKQMKKMKMIRCMIGSIIHALQIADTVGKRQGQSKAPFEEPSGANDDWRASQEQMKIERVSRADGGWRSLRSKQKMEGSQEQNLIQELLGADRDGELSGADHKELLRSK